MKKKHERNTAAFKYDESGLKWTVQKNESGRSRTSISFRFSDRPFSKSLGNPVSQTVQLLPFGQSSFNRTVNFHRFNRSKLPKFIERTRWTTWNEILNSLRYRPAEAQEHKLNFPFLQLSITSCTSKLFVHWRCWPADCQGIGIRAYTKLRDAEMKMSTDE